MIRKNSVAEGTVAFELSKPAGFSYKAGQFANYTLLNPAETDAKGSTRGFSLASAPYQDTLMFATRMRDTAFKRVIKEMPIGTEVVLDAPYGDFTLHHAATKPAVFLIGGIGITPVRSILLQAAYDHSPQQLVLFYANHRPEDAAFLDELVQLQKQNSAYRFVGVMSRMETSHQSWTRETGHITGDLLRKYLTDLATPRFYLAGPASMVRTMRTVLNDAGVDDDDVKTEEFTGYCASLPGHWSMVHAAAGGVRCSVSANI